MESEDECPLGPDDDDRPGGPGATAGEVVLASLRGDVETLRELETGVIVDAPDAVHRSRVATRRIRSTLRTFGAVFEPGSVERLRGELRWLATRLGVPRDAEVLRASLMAQAASLQPGLRDDVISAITRRLDPVHTAAHAELVASVGSQRYVALRSALVGLVLRPPFSAAASRSAGRVLPPLYRGAVSRVERLARRAAEEPLDPVGWHDVRKAAKGARYGAELLRSEFGEPAERVRAAWEQVTEALGESQDAVVAGEVLGGLLQQALAQGRPVAAFEELLRWQDARREAGVERGRDALRWPTSADAQAFLLRDGAD